MPSSERSKRKPALLDDHWCYWVDIRGFSPMSFPVGRSRSRPAWGQVHYWFLFHVKHSVGNVSLPPDSEFRAVARVSFRNAVRRAAPFKRPVYRQLLQDFGDAVRTLRFLTARRPRCNVRRVRVGVHARAEGDPCRRFVSSCPTRPVTPTRRFQDETHQRNTT
jgi:hypothetical protein